MLSSALLRCNDFYGIWREGDIGVTCNGFWDQRVREGIVKAFLNVFPKHFGTAIGKVSHVTVSFGLLGFGSFDLLDFCTFELLDFWTFGLWGFGTFGLLDFGTLGLWEFGTLGLWDFGTVGIWDFGTLGLWDFGTF